MLLGLGSVVCADLVSDHGKPRRGCVGNLLNRLALAQKSRKRLVDFEEGFWGVPESADQFVLSLMVNRSATRFTEHIRDTMEVVNIGASYFPLRAYAVPEDLGSFARQKVVDSISIQIYVY